MLIKLEDKTDDLVRTSKKNLRGTLHTWLYVAMVCQRQRGRPRFFYDRDSSPGILFNIH